MEVQWSPPTAGPDRKIWNTAVAVTFLMGVLLAPAAARVAGILGSPARMGESQPAPRESSSAHDDLAAAVNVLPPGGLLVGPHDEAMKVNIQGTMTGLARETRVGPPGLLDRVRQMRRTNTEYLGNVIQNRPPGMDGIKFSARVLPLGRGFALVMAEDGAATQRVDAVRGDFVTNVSHELKTPIGAMGILVEIIEVTSEDPRQVAYFAQRLQRESARLAEFVGQIIKLSRLRSLGPMLNREVVDVKEIVDEAIGRTREAAEACRINLARAAMPRARALGDRWQLIDAVINFMQNTINYSDDNARVVMTAAQVRDEDDDRAEITMTDNGIGISQEDQERIFERFYRADYGCSRESGGTGLGLLAARHIVLVHKGSVRVWSRPRRGSIFTLRLPTHQDGVADGETREK